MPILLRLGPYRFHCYAADRHEPPHVHVERDRSRAKFWLDPVRCQENNGFTAAELRRVSRIVERHQASLSEAWHEFFRDAD